MAEDADWAAGTWEGSRRRQHQDFLALPFREKLAAAEDLAELAQFFAQRRRRRGLPVSHGGPGSDDPLSHP